MHRQHDLSVPVHDARYDAVVIGCILSVHLPPGDPQRRQSAILIATCMLRSLLETQRSGSIMEASRRSLRGQCDVAAYDG